MGEFMGVRVDPVDQPVNAEMQKLTAAVKVSGKVATGQTLLLDGRMNDTFKAVNLLLEKGLKVRRVDKAETGVRPGDFVVPQGPALAAIADQTGVDFKAVRSDLAAGSTHEVKRMRIGIYQRYGGGNVDEGWTRLLIEQFKFPYATVMDPEIQKGNLNDKYDVVIFPDDSTATITGERPAAGAAPEGRGGGRGGGGGGGGEGGTGGNYPPEYRSGIGATGVTALRAFVQKGGTIVTLGNASTFAMERLGVSVRNPLAGKSTKEFWCPGSTLKIKVDSANPMGYGMPSDALAVYLMGNPVFEIVPNDHNERYEVIATYADRDILQSGWLVGEQNLAKKAGMVVAHQGDGRVILIGFRAQHRAQAYGTFKLLFNALFG